MACSPRGHHPAARLMPNRWAKSIMKNISPEKAAWVFIFFWRMSILVGILTIIVVFGFGSMVKSPGGAFGGGLAIMYSVMGIISGTSQCYLGDAIKNRQNWARFFGILGCVSSIGCILFYVSVS